MTNPDLQKLGAAVNARRRELRLTTEAAARLVPMSPITWKRVEDGQPVREMTYSGVEAALEWPAGYASRLLAGENADPLPERQQVRRSGDNGGRDSVETSEADDTVILMHLPPGATAGLSPLDQEEATALARATVLQRLREIKERRFNSEPQDPDR